MKPKSSLPRTAGPLLVSFAILLVACLLVANKPFATGPQAQVPTPTAATSELENLIPENQATTPQQADVQAEQAGEALIRIEEIVVALLLVAALVGLLTQRLLRIPYTVGLVLVGFGLTFFNQTRVQIAEQLILALLVPPLVFEAAFHLRLKDLRRDLGTILLLAVPGVILTTLLVAGAMSLFPSELSLASLLVFGALIAATDPVSVVSLFRSLGVPHRLQVLLEGESLLNDGTAIVVFGLLVAAAMGSTLNLVQGVLDFVVVAGGGLLVGAILGIMTAQLLGRIDDYLIEITLTTVLVFGVFLLAEEILHVSGVLAVVAAGLSVGNLGPRRMSPTARIVLFNFWEYAAFLANSFVFLIIGLQIQIQLLFSNWPLILAAIVAALVVRAVTIYGLSWISRDVSNPYKHVMVWGGLRGAISLALVLSLSSKFPGRDQLQAMAFGVVLFTLLVQGLTMSGLVRHLGLIQHDHVKETYNLEMAKSAALRAGQQQLNQMHRHGSISELTYQAILPVIENRLETVTDGIQASLKANPDLRVTELAETWREVLRSQRSALTAIYRENGITEDAYTDMVARLDTILGLPAEDWHNLREINNRWYVPQVGRADSDIAADPGSQPVDPISGSLS